MVLTTSEQHELYVKISILIALTAFIAGCSSISTPDINTMMDHLRSNYPAIIALIKAVAYLSGIFLIFSAVHRLRMYGQVTTMMPGTAEFFAPMMQLFIGIILLFLPTMIKISAYSLWGTDSIISNLPTSSNWASVESAIIGLVKIFGYIAFVRGLLLMAKSSHRGAPQGLVGKGMIHLVGGILAIHIEGTINVIMASFGILT